MCVEKGVSMNRALVLCLLLVGCDTEYRYPCQDHQNWDKQICKPPDCEIQRDCPKYIFETQPEVLQIVPSEKGAKK